MDLLNAAERHSAPGETTQRLSLPPMPAYDHLVPPGTHVVTEPAAELERIAVPADHRRAKAYAARHRRPSLLAALLRRIGVVR